MPTEVIIAVLAGAMLHAGWNAVIKSSPDTFLDTVLVTFCAACLAGVAVLVLPSPLHASWPFLAASGAIHVAYFALVAAAYRVGDMSYAYPLMRGSAPLLVAAATTSLAGERPGPGTWGGILLVCGGILGLALGYRRSARSIAATTAFALANAVVVAGYTLVDGLGVRRAGNAWAYTSWVFLLTALPLLASGRYARGRSRLAAHLRARWRIGLLGGACTLGSYALALWAMTRAAIAPVAALRETSILFGMGLAALVLHERFGAGRLVAAAAVAAGVVTLRLAG